MCLSSLPNPRYRIYTKIRSYSSMLKELLVSGSEEKPGIKELETALCRHFDVKGAVCTPQNRVGVYLTIKNTIKPGQGVIMSPYTIADIINMVICAGGKPLFADVERETCNISAKEVLHLLETNDNIGAVLITHLHGLAAPSHEIRLMCEQHKVPMIEDAAQGFGAREEDRLLGTIGMAGVFSFGMFKNINTWYGGAVISNNTELTDKIRNDLKNYEYQSKNFILKRMKKGVVTDLATHPLIFKLLTFWVFRFGYLNDIEAINKKVRTELDVSPKDQIPDSYLERLRPCQGRLALSQLNSIDSDSKIRIDYARIYHKGLVNIPDLIIPPMREDFSHIYTYFPIQYRHRTKLLKWMMSHNRDAAAQHYKNCADLPGFSKFYRDCPNAREVAKELIFLPTYPRYGKKQVVKNVECIQKFFKQEMKLKAA